MGGYRLGTTLRDAGFRVITFDNRGHGRSAKLYDPSAYPAPVMAEDAHRLLEHLELRTAAVIGYSMGARIAAFLTIQHPALVSRAVFAGLAENMILGLDGSDDIADALEAASAEEIASAEAGTFRRFAEQTGSDLRALAACMRSARRKSRGGAGHDQVPGAGRCGQRGSPCRAVEPLVAALAHGKGLMLEGRNHMSAVGDRRFKSSVLEFLAPLKGGWNEAFTP